MQQLFVFDVVGTLLDLSALDPLFEQHLGIASARKEWFAELLKCTLTSAATNAYLPFNRLAQAALQSVEELHGRRLSDEAREQILQAMRKLPAYPDVKPGLKLLKESGNRIVALTNSGREAASDALRSAGVLKYFESVLSVENVQRFKPAAEPYRWAAQELKVGISAITLVAAHSWDICGATWAGCQTAFVQRPEQVLSQVIPRPKYLVAHLMDLAEMVISAKAA